MEAELGGDAVATYEQQLASEQREREEHWRAVEYARLTEHLRALRDALRRIWISTDRESLALAPTLCADVARYTNERAQLIEEA